MKSVIKEAPQSPRKYPCLLKGTKEGTIVLFISHRVGTTKDNTMTPEFRSFGKIHRLYREVVITEKIDGTNAQILIGDCGNILGVGSRNRWITPTDDNFGFAKWVKANEDELKKLGPGAHFGEWWGQGIQSGYGLKEKRFSLFNTHRWGNPEVRPVCCSVVPVLYNGVFSSEVVNNCISMLKNNGSVAAPGFMKPEGVVVFHTAASTLFKVTVDHDEIPKGLVA